MQSGAPPARADLPSGAANTLAAILSKVDTIDETRLRLGVAVLLSAASVLFFRQAAIPALVATVAGAGAAHAVLYLGFHRLGLRGVDRFWPGASRGLGTALLVYCLSPPGLPLALAGGLAAIAVLVDSRQRRFSVPLALGGVLMVWPLIWLWRAGAGLSFLAPFQLRPLDEPIILWTRFQLTIDPVRLYTGNVAGPLGATSFGLAALGLLLLGYGRRVAWLYLAGFYAPLAVALAATRQPLTTYLLSGEALVLAGLIGAESRRLPRALPWRLGAGLVAGSLSAALLMRGAGGDAFGAGVVIAAALVSVFQVFGLAGSPAVVPQAAAAGQMTAAVPPKVGLHPGRVVLLILFAPLGLLLLWRDQSVPEAQRVTLVGLGAILYAAAVVASLSWFWVLRLPA